MRGRSRSRSREGRYHSSRYRRQRSRSRSRVRSRSRSRGRDRYSRHDRRSRSRDRQSNYNRPPTSRRQSRERITRDWDRDKTSRDNTNTNGVGFFERRKLDREANNKAIENLWLRSPEAVRSPSPVRSDSSSSRDRSKRHRRHKSHRKEKRRRSRSRSKSSKSSKRRERHDSRDHSLSRTSEKDKQIQSVESVVPQSSEQQEWTERKTSRDDVVVGPMPLNANDNLPAVKTYGKGLMRGEGEAIAAFVQSGKRIPRRGEIGLDSEKIEEFEKLGYVMSGSRHQLMNAMRMKKENMVIGVEEKRQLLRYAQEERMQRENKIVAQFREMVQEKLPEDMVDTFKQHQINEDSKQTE